MLFRSLLYCYGSPERVGFIQPRERAIHGRNLREKFSCIKKKILKVKKIIESLFHACKAFF